MTFGGLIAAYVVIATNGVAEWQPFKLPFQVWISTAIILTSSVTYYFGQRAIEDNDTPLAKKWLVATTVLGAAFISSQVLAWIALNESRAVYERQPLCRIFLYSDSGPCSPCRRRYLGTRFGPASIVEADRGPRSIYRRASVAQVVGWYWHFMGRWIVIFILLGFWK